jgi:chromosome segregation ATPase
MKINEAKKLDKLSQNHLIESKAIEIQNNEIKQYKNNIKSLKTELNNKNKQLKDSRKRDRELENEIQINYEEFQKEKEEMKGDIKNLKNENKGIKDENAKIKEKNEKIEEENAKIKEEIVTIKEENSTIKEENAKIKEEIAIIKEENATIKEENAKIKEENTKINSDIINLREKQETEDKRKEEKFKLFETEMNNKFDLLNQEYEGLKLGMLQSIDLVNYIKDINNKLIKNSLNNNQIIENYVEKINHLTNDNNKYHLEINNLKRDIIILKNEKENMSAYITQKNLDEEFKKLKNNYLICGNNTF